MRTITIVGGGVAGLALGIQLRRHDVPVKLFEAGEYPRHRVCGEFISGHGQEELAALGLSLEWLAANTRPAASAQFTLGSGRTPVRLLPKPATCVSRYALDAKLAAEFESLGGELTSGERWRAAFGEGVVRATGRRLQTKDSAGWRWFGLKVHARGVPMLADLEMHSLPDAYVGLCRLPRDEVNVCGLFRRAAEAPSPKDAFELLRGPKDSTLQARLTDASFDSASFCAVAGLSLKSEGSSEPGECSVGDAITMIPPVTGNGMSMALESAALAREPLLNYAAGGSWEQARAEVRLRCQRAFAVRLRWARWLHRLMFTRVSASPAGWFLLNSAWFWQFGFRKTRQ